MRAAEAVRELAARLHARGNPWRALAMLTAYTAYFDESGVHQGAPVTAIAGFVATDLAWRRLSSEWEEVLARLASHGVSWFHMAECMAGDGQFAGVPFPEREALVAYLAGVISRFDITAVWAAVNNEDFHRVAPQGAKFRKRYPAAYDLCFDEVVRQLWWWSSGNAGGSRVAVVFAVQPEYEDRNRETFGTWRRHPQAGEFLGGLTFDFPKWLVPLQSADMLAYEMAKYQEALEYGELSFSTNFQARTVLSKITEKHALHAGGIFGESALRTAVSLFEREGEIWPFHRSP